MEIKSGPEFAFSLAKEVYLEHNIQGYFLISKAPIRILRINQSLYSILQEHQKSVSLSEITARQPGLQYGHLLKTFMSLTYHGYYRLETIPDLKDYPRVSVIIPVRDPTRDLIDCLNSVNHLDYPADKLEILLVEDGLPNPDLDLSGFKLKHIHLAESRGAGTARNAGAKEASGDILAFLDADCIAGKRWLKELIPFFQIDGLGAAGGLVEGYYQKSALDRYEGAASSLNMGTRILMEGKTSSVLYVPTCNMLVRREVFESVGGFKDDMRVGEDVDFCWRMREKGYALLYVPAGKVAHKHRNKLNKMLGRRQDYGTSEAVLYRAHRDKKKRILIPLWAGLSFLAAVVAILLLSPYPLAAVLLCFGIDLTQKARLLKGQRAHFTRGQIGLSTLRSHFSFYYYTCFHLVRYYWILLLAAGFLYHPIWYFSGLAWLLTSIVDYRVKTPRLFYPLFLLYFTLEHLAYQIGVFRGCLKLRYFGSYLPVFSRRMTED